MELDVGPSVGANTLQNAPVSALSEVTRPAELRGGLCELFVDHHSLRDQIDDLQPGRPRRCRIGVPEQDEGVADDIAVLRCVETGVVLDPDGLVSLQRLGRVDRAVQQRRLPLDRDHDVVAGSQRVLQGVDPRLGHHLGGVCGHGEMRAEVVQLDPDEPVGVGDRRDVDVLPVHPVVVVRQAGLTPVPPGRRRSDERAGSRRAPSTRPGRRRRRPSASARVRGRATTSAAACPSSRSPIRPQRRSIGTPPSGECRGCSAAP